METLRLVGDPGSGVAIALAVEALTRDVAGD